MLMLNKDIDQITEEDLQFLIDNAVLESKTIEYKQSLPEKHKEKDIIKFLAAVSSFANTSGGDLIFGIAEDKGTPVSLVGLDIENIDNELTRLDSIIRFGIEPRILGIDFKPINLSNGKTAIVIRVPKSWISPHRVTHQGHGHFYARGANGKYRMDVEELRTAFNLSETVAQQIRMFREDRIAKIYANETPVPFYENAKIVIHLIPVISFTPGYRYDIRKVKSLKKDISALYCGGDYNRFNFDGYITYSSGMEFKSFSYLQLYNNGIIEAVDGLHLKPDNHGSKIPNYFERELIGGFSGYLDMLKKLNIEPPIFLFLSLLGVKGYTMDRKEGIFLDESYPIDRDILLIPEVVIENYNVEPQHILKPCFDSIWNACGFPESLNYDENGNWIER